MTPLKVLYSWHGKIDAFLGKRYLLKGGRPRNEVIISVSRFQRFFVNPELENELLILWKNEKRKLVVKQHIHNTNILLLVRTRTPKKSYRRPLDLMEKHGRVIQMIDCSTE